ncbi:OmpH family outer membrane protein [Taibaiella koreensis]|uniref:OmpH family outer membrane protein n=1 Tax=Taibaiella koreensis TaxID=1268548 RepID=UPI000E59A217|nr:OmpH family outer membrane protein [Taibaiella koreensis]
MKKILLAMSLVLMTGLAARAQRYCVIDSKYMLEKIPDYNNAQKQLDAASQGWQKEVDAKMQNIDQMYKSYQAERPMLSEDARKKREDEIVAKEKEAKDLQKKYFGYEGEVFKKRQSLVKPIQDKVYNAVQQYAQSRSFDMVYDKAGGITIFYADPKLDKSDEILKLIPGVK